MLIDMSLKAQLAYYVFWPKYELKGDFMLMWTGRLTLSLCAAEHLIRKSHAINSIFRFINYLSNKQFWGIIKNIAKDVNRGNIYEMSL